MLRVKKFGNGHCALKAAFVALCESLTSVRLLRPIEPVVQTHGYLLFGHTDASAAEVMCSLDPFAHVSHLSAMEYHGLTDRFPQVLSMTRPPAAEWCRQAKQKMLKDLGEKHDLYMNAGLPRLLRPNVLRLGQTAIQFHERSQLGAFRLVTGSSLRVATIGRVFLEMLREPQRCGGWQHVIDIFRREARRYLTLIVAEVNQHGAPVDKVRMGFVLSEVCGLASDAFDEWQKYAQRGGSRKLDAGGDYAPEFSERWKLSLNVPAVAWGERDE